MHQYIKDSKDLGTCQPSLHFVSTDCPISTVCVDFLNRARVVSFGSELASSLMWDNDWPP